LALNEEGYNSRWVLEQIVELLPKIEGAVVKQGKLTEIFNNEDRCEKCGFKSDSEASAVVDVLDLIKQAKQESDSGLLDWIDKSESLPEIPEGKYGVTVLVNSYDPQEQDGYQYEVTTASYNGVSWNHLTFNEHKKHPEWYWNQLYQVTHWMYMPKPIKHRKDNNGATK